MLAAQVWGRTHGDSHERHDPRYPSPSRLSLPDDSTDVLDVGSPFDYATNGLLYCATHLPDPAPPGYAAAMHDELEALITAAGGRTLALFTSWRAMDAAPAECAARLPNTSSPARSSQARADRGVSRRRGDLPVRHRRPVPGHRRARARPCRLVTIDRLPFPAPTIRCSRPAARPSVPTRSRLIDLPRAATLLAQAAGRLIRSATDRGVVAVLDRRLNTAATAGTSSRPCRRCAAPANGPRPRRS